MTTPNMVDTQIINGKTEVLAVLNYPQPIVSNASDSNRVQKINCLIVSNIDAVNAASITVDLYRGGIAYTIVSAVSISPFTSFTPIDKTLSLYLIEGDELRVTASADEKLQAVCSYEEIG